MLSLEIGVSFRGMQIPHGVFYYLPWQRFRGRGPKWSWWHQYGRRSHAWYPLLLQLLQGLSLLIPLQQDVVISPTCTGGVHHASGSTSVSLLAIIRHQSRSGGLSEGAARLLESLNSYRSAISSVHEKVDGIEVGKHPLVTRMLKGVFNERPPRPNYESVWKVN